MEITFDPEKDKLNRRKHGISLARAEDFEWGTAVSWSDQRFDYGELRTCAIGLIGASLYFLVYVESDEDVRVNSLRKANAKEEQRYVRQA
ncbi:MAG TPA: BrnT family toxin [Burkholderiaceae bacterium]|nr:BrnT family toxin [Burkholderiaceae bacterium]